MNNSWKHSVCISGSPDTQKLAQEIGDLRYDAIGAFFAHLARKFKLDADADAARGRKRLAASLYLTYAWLESLRNEMDRAYRICAPHMTGKQFHSEMNDTLQYELFAKYPKIFAQRFLPGTETRMCDGIDCGDGWARIIDKLCQKIQGYVDYMDICQIEAVQVKQKMGDLCFYTNLKHEDVQLNTLIREAQDACSVTCEVCGVSDETVSKTGSTSRPNFIRRLCRGCAGN